jgi:hypothetical protein
MPGAAISRAICSPSTSTCRRVACAEQDDYNDHHSANCREGCRCYGDMDCRRRQGEATPSGFLLALRSARPTRPRSVQQNAVEVTTYHKAKGLEWPIVILSSLNSMPKPRLFEPVAEADCAPTWRDPLAGRWIRYWPWPYGRQKAGVDLDRNALYRCHVETRRAGRD